MASDVKKTKLSNDDGTTVACHQCRAKRPMSVVLQCTRVRSSKRCGALYCGNCLKNRQKVRYGEILEIIKQAKPSSQIDGHVDVGYRFGCPRCEGNCNCGPCRKKQGLAPVGKFAPVQGQGSVREILEINPQALVPHIFAIPFYILPKTIASSKPKISGEVCLKVVDGSKGGKIETVKSKPSKTTIRKVVLEPTWTCIQYARSKEDIEDRILLREFVLRFNPILNVGVRAVEELDDFVTLHDASAKAILLSLLDLIAVEEEDNQKTIIREKLKIIRALGLNWTKIVQVLYDLRATVPKAHALQSIPELDQSPVESLYNTRGGQRQSIHTDQLLPILLHLIAILINGPSVREELEEGHKQGKELRGLYLTALREENERWAAEKATLLESKPENEQKTNKVKDSTWRTNFRAAEAVHKETISNLQNQHRAEMDLCTSRFMPVGFDMDGRTYYILSASGPQRGKKDRLLSEGERTEMKKWGWFIAVFGQPGSIVEGVNEDDNNGHEERWWGFATVKEMRQLSKWLAYSAESTPPNGAVPSTSTSSTLLGNSLSKPPLISNGEDSNAMVVDGSHQMSMDMHHSSVDGLKALAKAVLEFADFVDWRTKRDSLGGAKA
ncbi:hypothetical protein BU17DRAFT_53535 [Hysterangium stoloniferum]|nr:hypothetical protein BU17DRAFT_53535 [Hysterangium stoloniferum]